MMSEAKVYKKEEVVPVSVFAARLGISRSHAYQMVELGVTGGGVLAFRFGLSRCLRVPLTEIDRLKSQCRVEEGR